MLDNFRKSQTVLGFGIILVLLLVLATACT